MKRSIFSLFLSFCTFQYIFFKHSFNSLSDCCISVYCCLSLCDFYVVYVPSSSLLSLISFLPRITFFFFCWFNLHETLECSKIPIKHSTCSHHDATDDATAYLSLFIEFLFTSSSFSILHHYLIAWNVHVFPTKNFSIIFYNGERDIYGMREMS